MSLYSRPASVRNSATPKKPSRIQIRVRIVRLALPSFLSCAGVCFLFRL